MTCKRESHISTIVTYDERFTRHSEATLLECRGGSWLLAWSKFGSNHDNSGSHIAATISPDSGRTWTGERILVENAAGLNVMSPALRRLSDGSLGLLYNHRDSLVRATRIFLRSADEGLTWSKPVAISSDGYRTGAHDRFTVLSSGRLIAPLHVTDDWDAHYLYLQVARSDDLGCSWAMSEPIRLPKVAAAESGAQEPDVVERAESSLLMVMRTAMGTIFRAESHDQGETWTDLQSMEVVAPIAPCIVRRMPGSSDLLLVWNWTYDPLDRMGGRRHRLAYAISHDGG